MTAVPGPRRFRAPLLESRDECPDVRTLRFSVPSDFEFLPGMWVMLSFSEAENIWRAYSIATSPLERGAIELTVGRVGDFSKRLFALRPGDEIELKGPYGKCIYAGDARYAVLISGGTGITPFRSMARYALARRVPDRLTILYSCRSPVDILYRDELERFREAGIKVYATVTRDAQRWTGPTGRIDLDVIRREVPAHRAATYYLCGPATLVRDLTRALADDGVPAERLRHEIWGDYRDLSF